VNNPVYFINEEKNKPLKLREQAIEKVDEFTYLASIIAEWDNIKYRNA
jgi:hypothetical protein